MNARGARAAKVRDGYYRRTSYWVDAPDCYIRLRVGQANPLLDALLRRLGATTWAYITAFDPRDEKLPPAKNEARQSRLERQIRSLGYRFYAGVGAGESPKAPRPPRSVLIIGIDEAGAIELGSRWGQHAILAGRRGGKVRLKYIP